MTVLLDHLRSLLTSPPAGRLGWALLHSLWTGVVVAVALGGTLVALRRRSANARYCVACIAMLLLVALPATACLFTHVPRPAPSVAMEARPALALRADVHELSEAALVKSPADLTDGVSPNGSAVAAVEPTPPSPDPGFAARLDDLLPWCVLAWAVGVAGMSLWQLAGLIAAARLTRLAGPPQDDALIARVARLARRLKVSRPVRVLESLLVRVPTVVGWLRPAILLPVGLVSGLSTSQVEAVLAHELGHIRRHDYLVNLIQSAIETLLFYHPATWWVSRRVRAEREDCCDDIALAAGADRLDYAEMLLALVGATPAGGLGMAGRPSQLRRRVQRLLARSAGPARTVRTWPIALLLAIVLVAGPIASGTPSAEEPAATSEHRAGLSADQNVSPSDARIGQGEDMNRTQWAAALLGGLSLLAGANGADAQPLRGQDPAGPPGVVAPTAGDILSTLREAVDQKQAALSRCQAELDAMPDQLAALAKEKKFAQLEAATAKMQALLAQQADLAKALEQTKHQLKAAQQEVATNPTAVRPAVRPMDQLKQTQQKIAALQAAIAALGEDAPKELNAQLRVLRDREKDLATKIAGQPKEVGPPAAAQPTFTAAGLLKALNSPALKDVRAEFSESGVWSRVEKSLTAAGDRKFSRDEAIELLHPIKSPMTQEQWDLLRDVAGLRVEAPPVVAPKPAPAQAEAPHEAKEMREWVTMELLKAQVAADRQMAERAQLLIKEGRYEQAIELLNTLLGKNPTRPTGEPARPPRAQEASPQPVMPYKQR